MLETLINRRQFMGSSIAALSMLTSARLSFSARPRRKKGFCGARELYSPSFGCSWYYNWRFKPYDNISIPFYPMVWGWGKPEYIENLTDLPGKPNVLFGFNEPDGKRQANLSVPEALDAWPLFQNLADEIVSPSCVNASGRWMTEFMRQADLRKLRVDSIGVHSYTSPNVDAFIEKLETIHRIYARPIWITEFAVADWKAGLQGRSNRFRVDDTVRFLVETCRFLEETPWIKGYCWMPAGVFGAGGPLSTSAFYDEAGNFSPVASAFKEI